MTAERSTPVAKRPTPIAERPTPNCRECNAGKKPARPAPSPTPPTSPFVAPYERDPRTPEPPKWNGRWDPLPEPQYLPVFKNFQFRYGAYPGFRDCSKKPLWPDGAVAEHARRQESPVKGVAGRKGRTTFKPTERVCGDLQFARQSAAKKAHEFIWYYIKDPDVGRLKPPRRWNPQGLKKFPPRPFYNREDGHMLLNNTCTIAGINLIPELRRLQCYFFPKLPRIRKERNFYLPMKKHGRQHTRWRWTETWKRQLIPWRTDNAPVPPEVYAEMWEDWRVDDRKHTMWHYRMNKGSIEKLRAWHRRPRGHTPPPPKPPPIDYHVKLGKESILGVRKVKELFEDPILWFWTDPPVDIMEIIMAEAAERKRLEEEAKKKNPTPPPPPSICDACDYYGERPVVDDRHCVQCASRN